MRKKRIKEDLIIVRSQAEIDMLPDDYEGVVEVEFGTEEAPATLYSHPKTTWVIRKGYAQAFGFSRVSAKGTACVNAFGKSVVWACDNAFIQACDISIVLLSGYARAYAFHNACVKAEGHSTAFMYGYSYGQAAQHATVVFCENSSGKVYDAANAVYATK